MVNRIHLECDTCDQGINLRAGMGAQARQIISVKCPQCNEKVGLVLLKESNKHRIKELINAKKSDNLDETAITINFHPELIYRKEFIHEDLIMHEAKEGEFLKKHAIEKDLFDYEAAIKDSIFGTPIISAFDGLGGDSKLLEDWNVIEVCWRLKDNSKDEIYNKKIKEYSRYNQIPSNSREFNDILFDFFYRFINPNIKLYQNLEDEFEKARKSSPHNFNKVKKYYIDELQENHWSNYLKLFKEYFKNFDEYNRLLINTKIELHPEEGTEHFFCPLNFDDVDMFYGNAFEYVTSHIEPLVLINNVLSGRDFNDFLEDNVTHIKYKNKYTKAQKSEPLKDNEVFYKFTEHFDNKIRNASHHKNLKIDKKNVDKLIYQSSPGGQKKYISYIDYIYKCNQMALSLASLLMLEIYILD